MLIELGVRMMTFPLEEISWTSEKNLSVRDKEKPMHDSDD